jgi:signal transduction histidine kinase
LAHDFNNLLTVILSFTQFVVADMGPQDPRREDALQVQRAAERAASLTRQLLAFSRRQVLQPRSLDLNDVLVDLEKMLLASSGRTSSSSWSASPACGR